MNYTVIDVREPEEFTDGHIEGAINIPPSSLIDGAKELDAIPQSTPIILYCRTGSRSNVAKQILESKGYTNVINGINKDQVSAKYGL